jgi:hypothetical protein
VAQVVVTVASTRPRVRETQIIRRVERPIASRNRIPETRRCCQQRPEAPEQPQDAALEAVWRANADQVSHEEAEIAGAGLQQHAFQNVLVIAVVSPSSAS